MTVSWFGAFAAFLRRDWALAKSYRLSFVLELFGTFFSLALFFYLSKLIDGSEIARSRSRTTRATSRTRSSGCRSCHWSGSG